MAVTSVCGLAWPRNALYDDPMGRFFVVLAVTAGFLGFAACGGSDGDGDGGGGSDGGGASLAEGGDGGAADDGATPDSASDAPADSNGSDTSVVQPFTLTSMTFNDEGLIPPVHTCTGTNQSPPLAWANPPPGTKSFAIVMRDIDAPDIVNNYHWVLFDIDASYSSLPQAIPNIPQPSIPAGGKQTYWSFGNEYSFKGPCPPTGVHRYVFTIYSFATPLLPGGPSTSPALVDSVIQSNKTGSATLTGRYAK